MHYAAISMSTVQLGIELEYLHCPHFLQSMISEKIFVFVFAVNLCSVSPSLHICRTSWQDTQNYKSNHVFLVFPFRPQMFWGRVEKIFKNGQCSYLGSWKFKANIWIFQIAFSQWIAPLIAQLQKYIKIEHEVFRGRSVQRPKRAQMINFLLFDWKGHKEKDGGKHSLNLAESSTFTSIWTLFTFWGDMSNKKPFSELFSKNNLEIYDKSVAISFICWNFCVAQRSFVHNGNGFLVNIWISK